MTKRAAEYVTAHVRLPRELYQMLKQRADKENTSMTGLIRDSLVAYLTRSSDTPEEDDSIDPIYLLSTLASEEDALDDAPHDGSIRHDHYAYQRQHERPHREEH